ncbi:tyrosine-type recombinase/integrase [Methylobacterium sp. E-005]|uniref:tyrosine-type recombinase/integrase n=1 Tax=Methylobacterium sp. E-005 TaxID=2836549 RepID=UPI001FB9B4A9|nr:site-specific integrase [Methylobacterium sp. E-005]MCJ2088638.1 tyrosine-type recombinase/integrase [Methylobacterium sp. E-005]
MRVKLTGINTVRRKLADGTIRTHYYHRATGTKLQGEPGSAEFVASYQDAGRSAALNRSQGTVEWLIRQYQASRAWTKKLSDKTRANEEFNIRACEAKWGKTPLKIVENPRSRPPFLKWHEQLAEDHPRAADAKLARLAKVFAWGVDHGHIRHNPIATFERAYSSTRAEIIWLPEHVKAFEAVARPEIRLAMMLALHTGQRQGDLLKLTWSAWDGAAITLKQGKSKRTVYVPATRALKTALDAAPRRAGTILVASRGGPWLKRRFHKVWSETFAAARIAEGLHFHDLRGTAVTMLAEAGCNVPEIATITGHSQAHAQKILDQYLARTRSLAESAIAKLDEHERNRQKPNRPANDAANGEKGDGSNDS